MHETHLIEPIIKGISEHAKREGAQKVTNIKLKIGALACANESSFRETFSVLSKGTLLENAKLEITMFPGTNVQVLSFDVE
ncbi:MAG: hydrogenase maturation nickel metallochaperone HypA [Candidatus Omnitrophica bacterium]|jgi:hydrogenase nickel incorporation protein HypA/HybF|nr:hydrogenase maturation nickel metallochaperone HypA [Candidatus Omnitrophota bacterium]